MGKSTISNRETFSLNADDDCEKRLQRLREVTAGVKNLDFSKYASSSRSCEADDEFDDDEERTEKGTANAETGHDDELREEVENSKEQKSGV